jgi:hypothetical protein
MVKNIISHYHPFLDRVMQLKRRYGSLILLFVLYTVIFPSILYAGLYDSDWALKCFVIIDNTENSTSLSNYQIVLKVEYREPMHEDFRDIRFTDREGKKIPYWIEEFSPGKQASVWIKIPSIPAEGKTTVYLHYGNPDAMDESDAETVFDYYEDFNDGDISTWTQKMGSWTAENQFLQLRTRGNHQEAYSSFSFDYPIVVEAKMNYLSTYEYAGIQISFLERSKRTGYKFGWSGLNTGGSRIARIDGSMSVSHLVSDPSINVIDHNNQWLHEKVTYDGEGNFTLLLTTPQGKEVYLHAHDVSHTPPFTIGTYGSEMAVDDLRVRKYTKKEPIVSIEETPLPLSTVKKSKKKEREDAQPDSIPVVYKNIPPTPQGGSVFMVTENGESSLSRGGSIHGADVLYPTSDVYHDTGQGIEKKETEEIVSLITVDPDHYDSVSVQDTVHYTLTVTNKGIKKDLINISLEKHNHDWFHFVSFKNGSPLTDTDNNGELDIGYLPPGSAVSLTVKVSPPIYSHRGKRDVSVLYVYSTNDRTVYDSAILSTLCIGHHKRLFIEPHYTKKLDFGMLRYYPFTLYLVGEEKDFVEVFVEGSSKGWTYKLLSKDHSPLVDRNNNGKYDIGWLEPYDTVEVVLMVKTPIGITKIDSLTLHASLIGETSRQRYRDYALVHLMIKPRFDIHSYANRYEETTTFKFTTPAPGTITLSIYDEKNTLVKVLIQNKYYEKGIYLFQWNNKDSSGESVPSGEYRLKYKIERANGKEREINKSLVILHSE